MHTIDGLVEAGLLVSKLKNIPELQSKYWVTKKGHYINFITHLGINF